MRSSFSRHFSPLQSSSLPDLQHSSYHEPCSIHWRTPWVRRASHGQCVVLQRAVASYWHLKQRQSVNHWVLRLALSPEELMHIAHTTIGLGQMYGRGCIWAEYTTDPNSCRSGVGVEDYRLLGWWDVIYAFLLGCIYTANAIQSGCDILRE